MIVIVTKNTIKIAITLFWSDRDAMSKVRKKGIATGTKQQTLKSNASRNMINISSFRYVINCYE